MEVNRKDERQILGLSFERHVAWEGDPPSMAHTERQMITRDEAMRKAIKLLKLAEGTSFAQEAATAAAQAQAIIDKWNLENLEAAALGLEHEPEEPIQNWWSEPLTRKHRLVRWQGGLAMVLARHNACQVYYQSGTGNLVPIGRKSDVTALRYMFDYLVAEIDRLTALHCKGEGRTYANNFRLGIVEVVKTRLADMRKAEEREMKEQRRAAAKMLGGDVFHALVPINTAIEARKQQLQSVKDWTAANMGLGRAKRSYASYDHGAREHGRQVGATIDLNRRSAGYIS